MGLIFAEKSKRYISFDKAKALTKTVPFDYVGVFVDADMPQVIEYAHELGLASVQLHGQEDQNYIDKLRKDLPVTCEIWKAVGVEKTTPSIDFQHVDRILLDCKIGQQSGGTGQTFNWQIIQSLGDSPLGRSLMLAGGLAPDNIIDAVNQPVIGLDINSGVESSPGVKDKFKLARTYTALRTY